MYDVKIGLEVHAQIDTKQKLYCDCPTDYFTAQPNRNTCPICLGLPGNKPMPPNRKAVDAAMEVALMLGAHILLNSKIYVQRKHYDYPDLPNGYQKTTTPIAEDGELCNVGIREIHLEDDPGRYDLLKGRVDYNRCGIPLVEIITEPDIKSAQEARNFWNELTKLLEYTEKMRTEPGTIRADTNVSVKGGERVEVKNINSATGIRHAIAYEIKRQNKVLRRKRKVRRETRGFLEDKMITTTLRTKETFADYRYIPDPDIPPIIITERWLREIQKCVKETPIAKRERFISVYGISGEQAGVLASNLRLANFYEEVAKRVEPQYTAGWITVDLKGILNEKNMKLEDTKITPERMGELLHSVYNKKIPRHIGKNILRKMTEEDVSIEDYVKKFEFKKKIDIEKIISSTIVDNPEVVNAYKAGKKETVDFLVGQIMKKTEGKVDPEKVNQMIREKLSKIT